MPTSIIVSGPIVGTEEETDYPLAVDPGSTGNMAVNVSGLQLDGEDDEFGKPIDPSKRKPILVTHSDGSTFSDGSSYSQ